MFKPTLFLLWILSSLGTLLANEGIPFERIFIEANTAYVEKDFTKAIELYRSLVDEHQVTQPEIYYNLGNAYAKVGRLGSAILYYERARLLLPRDPEIINNLNYVKGLVNFKVDDRRNIVLQYADRLFAPISQKEALLGALLLYALWASTMALYFLSERPRTFRFFINVLFAGLLFSSCCVATKYFLLNDRGRAIVVTERADTRYGPTMQDKVFFELPAGFEVHVAEERDTWSRIRLVDGRSGWIRNEMIERI